MLGVEHTVIESVDLESDGRGGEILVCGCALRRRGAALLAVSASLPRL